MQSWHKQVKVLLWSMETVLFQLIAKCAIKQKDSQGGAGYKVNSFHSDRKTLHRIFSFKRNGFLSSLFAKILRILSQ